MTLDQVMAFTVSGDHERQEQVFERLKAAFDKQPHTIRRMLTEGSVRAADKRARFIGVDAYAAAGGAVLRDLFQGDDGGWLQDVALVDQMVADKLKADADAIAAEGWKWIDVAPDFPYGHAFGLRQLRGETIPLTAEERASRDALQAEIDRLSGQYDGAEAFVDLIRQFVRRTRDRDRRLRHAAGQVRPGGDRARRSFCRHRPRLRPARRARLCPARGRTAA